MPTLSACLRKLSSCFPEPCRESRNRPRRSGPGRGGRARPERLRAAAAESGTWAASTTAVTPLARIILARSPASPSETSMAALACSRSASASLMARLGVEVAVGRRCASSPGESLCAQAGRLRSSRPSAASPMVPVTQIRSPGLGRGAPDHAAGRDLADGGDRQGQRPRASSRCRRRGAGRRNPGAASPRPPAKAASQSSVQSSGKARLEQETGRDRRPWRQDPRRSRRAPCGRSKPADRPGRKWTRSTTRRRR